MPFDTSQSAHEALRDIVAERTKPLLAWVGSGLSVAAGLPSWPDLKQRLIEELESKAGSLDRADANTLNTVIEGARREPNFWTAFHVLRQHLGQATYRDTIRDALAPATTADIPDAYRQLWELRIRGLLNLNLDRLATRALSEIEVGTALAEYEGREVARLRPVLNGHKPFIANLHGTADATASWVFTRPELNTLLKDEAYRSFIELCVSTHTVLFLGVTADDLAVGGHLERLAKLGVETDSHFWLTDRRDFNTDKWAEAAGIRVIRYASTSGDHSEVDQFFSDLRTFVPEEPSDTAPPVALTESPSVDDKGTSLPAPAELATWDAEEIRLCLNSQALDLLQSGDEASYEAYDEFCSTYDEAIYRAWYTSTREPANVLLGYTLHKEVARGAFGRVYEAASPKGDRVAVKVLLEEIRNDGDHLRSFRRGVRSMRILHERGVEGMVAYLEASEIPAFVVMEWVEGPNLVEAAQARQAEDWATILKIGSELAHIIRNAHALPERVLHRDIRPSNVMLEGFYTSPDQWRVVVLDFDLSWHRGAFEQSVLHTTSAGYLAPEQIRAKKGVSTRSAAVDSFGVGMTLLYLCSHEDPLPDHHRHRDWAEHVTAACGRVGQASWRSLPARFARLIMSATRDTQAARWDMTDVANELDRLREVLDAPSSVRSAELLTEELAANCEVMSDYEWDSDSLTASRSLPTGMRIELVTEVKDQRVHLRIQWTSTGVEDRRGVGKYIVAAARTSEDQLRAAGWERLSSDVGRDSVYIAASLESPAVAAELGGFAESIDRATRKLRFNEF